MVIQAHKVKKTYIQGNHEVHALREVSFAVPRGQFTSIMGPSGSGKSTLLHLLGGLDRPTSGFVEIDGQLTPELTDNQLSAFRRQKLGFIFQFFNLLPTLTALENVALPSLLDGKTLKQVSAKATELLKMMNLGHRLDHKPDELSGGEMQRVAIARALIADPVLILADEPTGNLDSKTGAAVLEMLSYLAREKGQTVVMVTHDPKAAAYGHRLITMRDGRIESDENLATNARPPQHSRVIKPELSGELEIGRPIENSYFDTVINEKITSA